MPHAGLIGSQAIGDAQAARVVKMGNRHHVGQGIAQFAEQLFDRARVAHTRGVADGDITHAPCRQPAGVFDHARGCNRSFKRATESRGHRAYDLEAVLRSLDHGADHTVLLVAGALESTLQQGVARDQDHADLARAMTGVGGRDRALHRTQVDAGGLVAGAGCAPDAAQYFAGVGELRHVARMGERGGLHAPETECREAVYQRDLVFRRHKRRFVLQTVARKTFTQHDRVTGGWFHMRARPGCRIWCLSLRMFFLLYHTKKL